MTDHEIGVKIFRAMESGDPKTWTERLGAAARKVLDAAPKISLNITVGTTGTSGWAAFEATKDEAKDVSACEKPTVAGYLGGVPFYYTDHLSGGPYYDEGLRALKAGRISVEPGGTNWNEVGRLLASKPNDETPSPLFWKERAIAAEFRLEAVKRDCEGLLMQNHNFYKYATDEQLNIQRGAKIAASKIARAAGYQVDSSDNHVGVRLVEQPK